MSTTNLTTEQRLAFEKAEKERELAPVSGSAIQIANEIGDKFEAAANRAFNTCFLMPLMFFVAGCVVGMLAMKLSTVPEKSVATSYGVSNSASGHEPSAVETNR